VRLRSPFQVLYAVVASVIVQMTGYLPYRARPDEGFQDQLMNLPSAACSGAEADFQVSGMRWTTPGLSDRLRRFYKSSVRVQQVRPAYFSTVGNLVSGVSGYGLPDIGVGHDTRFYALKGT